MDDINYKVIELEAENEKLKDEIITLLKDRIKALEDELALRNQAITTPPDEEVNVSSHMIASSATRPVFRTISEVVALMEQKSLFGANRLKEEGTKNA